MKLLCLFGHRWTVTTLDVLEKRECSRCGKKEMTKYCYKHDYEFKKGKCPYCKAEKKHHD